MTRADRDGWLIEIAWRLDRLRWVPRSVLATTVQCSGACMVPSTDGDVPLWNDEYLTDRELAAVLCAGCSVRDECLELELRIAADQSVGVWGALSDDDRRSLYPHWLRRGERVDESTPCSDEGVWR
jgi:WhiB family transcriptional regulator, redox-sensing transcriptional regulator